MGADFPKPSKLPPRRRQLIEPQNKAYHNNHIVICSRGTNAYYLSPPTRSRFWWEGDEVLGKTSCRLFSWIFPAGGPHFFIVVGALFPLKRLAKNEKNIVPKFDQEVSLKGTWTRSLNLFPSIPKIIYRAFGHQCVTCLSRLNPSKYFPQNKGLGVLCLPQHKMNREFPFQLS